MIDHNFSLRASAQYDLGFKDDWEGLVNGKRKDQAFTIRIGNQLLSWKQIKTRIMKTLIKILSIFISFFVCFHATKTL
jgi:hypothetical protein